VLLPGVGGIHRAEGGVDPAGGQGGVGVRLGSLAEGQHVDTGFGQFDGGPQPRSAGADDEDGGGQLTF
jgi:hypothetical protein